ncbi:MAG TPA: hypothetical protein VJ623_09260 [Holophagaceae bacterium]|nr:hypothetical protein [Holophagaceae bacterium]
MTPNQRSQRGEGKIGCMLTLLVMGALLAFAYKVGPAYYANMELADKADEVGSMGSRVPAEQVDYEMRAKARDLDIPEALKPGAIRVTKVMLGETGTCTIVLKYTRKIDLYGLTTIEIKQDKTIDKKIYGGF